MRKKWLWLMIVLVLVVVMLLSVGFVPSIVGQLLEVNQHLKYWIARDEELLFRQVEYTIYLQRILGEEGIEYDWYNVFVGDYLYPNGETLSECIEERMDHYERSGVMSR